MTLKGQQKNSIPSTLLGISKIKN